MKRPFKFRSDHGPVLSPDGRQVATVVRDVALFDVDTRKKVWKAHPFSYPAKLAFDASGRKLAVKSNTGQIVVLDSATGSVLIDFENSADGEGSNVCFSECGGYLIDGSWKGVLTVRSVDHATVVAQHMFERQLIAEVACIDGSVFVHHSHILADNSFTRWRWPIDQAEYDTFSFRPAQANRMCAFSADSFLVSHGQPQTRLALVNMDGAQDICDTSDYGRIDGVGLSPSRSFVACGIDRRVLFVGLKTRKLHDIMEVDARAFSFSFSTDGSRLAIGVGSGKNSLVVPVEDLLPAELA